MGRNSGISCEREGGVATIEGGVVKMPMKQWVAERALEDGVTTQAIWDRLKAGKYPKLKLKRKNKRVVFVVNPTGPRQ